MATGLSVLVLWTVAAAPAGASAPASRRPANHPQLTRVEERRFARWLDAQVVAGGMAYADMPVEELRNAAEQALAAGATRAELQAVLFSDAGRSVLAGNAAAGEGRPSPYVPYFRNNPTQLGSLGAFLLTNTSYVAGPGGTQDALFARFPGLRESYLASLGLMEVNGRIVDPRMPYLTPYTASLFLGAPQPLPQPAVALNVAAA